MEGYISDGDGTLFINVWLALVIILLIVALFYVTNHINYRHGYVTGSDSRTKSAAESNENVIKLNSVFK